MAEHVHSADQTNLRTAHDAMLEALSSRRSTLHFAHAAVSLFVAIVLGGTATKMLIEAGAFEPGWNWQTAEEAARVLALGASVVAALGALTVIYSAVRLVLGRRSSGRERAQLAQLLGLRKQLRVDEPLSFS